ncbi:sigma-54-dependent transcriptional regulator [Deferrisoma camini]|uniref:sigma-54-dependent transcriptional regulator n=1 Tax=Deferrisoma camini TaxID=1035120 RepID=UPI00046D10B3|nr:sigma-54 dependent transcriptional regulator [Deferrisoma camini]
MGSEAAPAGTKPRILVVDDDRGHRTMLRALLAGAGYETLEADDGDAGVDAVRTHPVDAVLLDLRMPRVGGIEALEAIKAVRPDLPVIVLTAYASVDTAVAAMKKGAFDYLTKPVDAADLSRVLDKALEFRRLEEEIRLLRERLGERFDFSSIIGRSRPMRELFETLALVAPSDATVLITGESGTGKELVANAIHQNSPRRDKPFVKVNCAALHENLLESELFGHERGAFTGATAQRKGRFELAHGGTLFLDEIGDMSPATQAKVLRVIQEGEFERLGGTRTLRVDVRVIAATHRDLEAMVAEGAFRQDLYYRLSVVPVHLPPLRDRPEDIPLLAEHFLRIYAEKNRKPVAGFTPEAMDLLVRHDWPGNVRELQNAVERAVILCLGERITPQELPPALQGAAAAAPQAPIPAGPRTLKDAERELILRTLEQTGGNRTRAAQILGISRQTLINKLKEYGRS